ncbi:hypothetical protein SAMN05421743_101193 [Thalassobacillus cyri]|uniref:Uncharacterized protein n=1 Tax=Thalassobacillus cyri TaxID=571932 RepID=A0A1H3VUV5_9BACI|nr:hypothetical protein [Thalassobacillus cyri]SDZ78567.1 hypothetical protein SAMN05421743_101193 [Thalassobacillus cyri]
MKKLLKSKAAQVTFVSIAVVIISSIFYAVGTTQAKGEFEDSKVTLSELLTKIGEAEGELVKLEEEVKQAVEEQEEKMTETEEEIRDTEKKLDKVKADYKKEKETYNEAVKVIAERDTAEQELSTFQTEIGEFDATIKAKKKEVSNLKNEIERLTNIIVETGEAPKEFAAGQYLVGQDFPEGRYKAVPVGEGSNFVIFNGSSGLADVNTILGDGSFGETEYIFWTSDGDMMETAARVKLIPLK